MLNLYILEKCFLLTFLRNPESFWSPKGGVGAPCIESRNWRECDSLLYFVIALHDWCNIENAVLCEVLSFEKDHALYFHLMYKDVDHLQNRMVHKLFCLKACLICKVHAHSYKWKNEPCMTLNYENTGEKSMTTDLKTNYDVVMNTVDVEKWRFL